MNATYVGEQTGGVEIDGTVVLPGETHEFPDGTVLSRAWKVDSKPAKPAKDGEP